MIDDYFGFFHKLLASEKISFSDPHLYSKLPERGGVYRILRRGSDWSKSLYVGGTDNLRRRVFRNHLMGNTRSSTLKKKLVKSRRFKDVKAVKDYFKRRCVVQFIVVKNQKELNFIEHFLISILRPKYND